MARLLDHGDPRRARGWRAARVGELVVVFNGHLANARALAAQLGCKLPDRPDPDDLARLYAAVVAAGGEAPDLRLIGEYAAAIIDPAKQRLRLARSPVRAPPLFFHADGQRVLVSSVPRVLLACGVEPRLNRAEMIDNAVYGGRFQSKGWYEGVERVPIGSVVGFTPGGVERHCYYDPLAIAPVRLPRPQDYVARAHELLGEGVAAAIDGFERPAVLLSGGLDSPQVALKVLDRLPADACLDTFTFTVSPDWDGVAPPLMFGDERPFVEAFAARHPRIRTHFFDNAANGFDYRLAETFHTAGVGSINQTNLCCFHDPWRAARDQGCDVILLSEWGNDTFSADGSWGFVEYFLNLRWRQLVRALRAIPDDPRPLWRKFVAQSVLPLLPDSLWRWQRRVRGRDAGSALATPLRREFIDSCPDAKGNPVIDRYPPRSHHAWLELILNLGNEDCLDGWQGFEQLYGIPQRDPTAYRPFVEFCFGSPTGVFMRDGQQRWLAREMARGIMPEPQRMNPREGRHHVDWHAKLTPRRAELREELDRIEDDPELAAMIDVPRLRAALDDWPEITPLDNVNRLPREVALTRGIMLARFVRFVSGRN